MEKTSSQHKETLESGVLMGLIQKRYKQHFEQHQANVWFFTTKVVGLSVVATRFYCL